MKTTFLVFNANGQGIDERHLIFNVNGTFRQGLCPCTDLVDVIVLWGMMNRKSPFVMSPEERQGHSHFLFLQ
jgi:hypothetical protein